MKKLLLLVALSFFTLNVHTHGEQWLGFTVLAKDVKWSPVQISLGRYIFAIQEQQYMEFSFLREFLVLQTKFMV